MIKLRVVTYTFPVEQRKTLQVSEFESASDLLVPMFGSYIYSNDMYYKVMSVAHEFVRIKDGFDEQIITVFVDPQTASR